MTSNEPEYFVMLFFLLFLFILSAAVATFPCTLCLLLSQTCMLQLRTVTSEITQPLNVHLQRLISEMIYRICMQRKLYVSLASYLCKNVILLIYLG